MESDRKVFDFFARFGHTEVTEYRLLPRKNELLSFAALETLLIMSNLVLFASDTPDLMMAGGAILAVFCGIALMGGRWVVGLLLRVLSRLRGRSLHREATVRVTIPQPDFGHEHDVRGVQRPLQRVA